MDASTPPSESFDLRALMPGRLSQIAKLVSEDGLTQAEIGRRLGLSPGRIGQLWLQSQRWEAENRDLLSILRVKAETVRREAETAAVVTAIRQFDHSERGALISWLRENGHIFETSPQPGEQGLEPEPPDLEINAPLPAHGTIDRCTHCNCRACRAAAAAAARAQRAAAVRALPAHGTDSRYTHHRCRCDKCRTANTRRCLEFRANRTRRSADDMTPAQHGVNGYSNWGCRCDICKVRWATECQRRYSLRRTRVRWPNGTPE